MTGDQPGDGPPRTTLGEVLTQRGATTPDVTAIASPDRAWTYGDLARRVTPPAGSPDARIAVDADDRFTLAVAVMLVAAHQVAVPVPDDLPAAARADVLARLAPAAVVPADAILAGDWEPVGPDAAATFDDIAVVLMTSGSSGRPKLVPNTHRNLWAAARTTSEHHRFGAGDRILPLGSMAHALGMRCFSDALWCGATMLVADDLDVTTIRQVLRELRPTCITSTPPYLHVLAAAFEGLEPGEREAVAADIRFIRCGSAAGPRAILERVGTLFGRPVLQGYGMSEAGKIAHAPLDGSAPPGSCGPPTGVELRLDDGEICVRGDVVSPGYLDDEHRSASAFVDGWFRTGDLGRLDEHGNLFVLGRRDDVVSRGGELVSLAALERELESHPAVQSALAADVPHPALGTDVVLGYVPEPGAPDPGALRAFLLTRMPVSQVPTRLVAIDALPITASGKPSRRLLAERFKAPEPIPATAAGRATDPDATELQLAALWCEVLGLDTAVGPADDFFALGGTSLQLLELCSMVADRLGVELAPAHVIAEPTLRGMAGVVRTMTGRQRRPVLIPLRAGQRGPLTLYLVPGAGGTLAALHRFVFNLDHGRRIVGFEAPGLYGGERRRRRVSSLARCYVEELLADHEGQRFAVIGTSFGSVVAQEMTRQLEALGTPPDVLVLVDGAVPHRRPTNLLTVKKRIWKVLHWRPAKRGGLRPRIHRHQLASRRSIEKHRPQPTAVPTIIVTSAQIRTRSGDPRLGWSAFVGDDITTLDFEGRHLELIRERTHEFAPELDRLLARYDPVEVVAEPA